ncbi:MAG: hypothetical protein WA139_02545 [Candidatus Aenigmatarchaeota archaeon]
MDKMKAGEIKIDIEEIGTEGKLSHIVPYDSVKRYFDTIAKEGTGTPDPYKINEDKTLSGSEFSGFLSQIGILGNREEMLGLMSKVTQTFTNPEKNTYHLKLTSI